MNAVSGTMPFFNPKMMGKRAEPDHTEEKE